ncbi:MULTISPECIES: Do family serine endopeptidase [Methylobacillus]|uniref:Peptidase S1 and S6, chymotrypsin/Hap n=1 Tax=Methylobacillus flagellatus (strain ATCC 51484 / DSM 6875 / VKM B-1610 / KT) TaxID=265072 RepID=Q1H4Q5_METFK|nr:MULTISPECIES: Do family serine endopeptidase [Methylobacillus]ABE48532.1 peptidase S1 and S6, chymotrypsin/Hap [Methylobacillus flagellatus KT]MPS49190.1 Do family serine endopeptidase [Methylobacillus sp.]
MRKLWLIFAQTVTISLAALFVAQLFYPQLLPFGDKSGTSIKEAPAYNPINEVSPNHDGSQAPPGSYRRAAQAAIPSVVNIFTSKKTRQSIGNPFLDDPLFRHFFGDQWNEYPSQRENSLGSGVIVNSQGLILTNHHVIDGADEIEVALPDGRTFPARIVGTDPETDLAVLKINVRNLPAITFAQSNNISVGDVVLAIGNPFGVGQTVTQGIISALGRSHLGINTFENFIQTDAPINPGNSGGALIDTEGNLVGINSAIYSRSGGSMGIGFAIPVSLAKQVMEQIIRQGSVIRGWIGIEAQDITPELAESFRLKQARGSLVAGVVRGSPADKAGLRPGDILLEIDGREVTDSSTMLNVISNLKPEKKVLVKIARNQTELVLPIVIGKRPTPQIASGR